MTSSGVDHGPFSRDPVEHIPLSGAPLVKVVCQVRWPSLTAFSASSPEVLKHVGKDLAKEFPISKTQRELKVVVSPAGMSPEPGGEVHQFLSADETWTFALADTFAALETTSYTSREDFCAKLESALNTVAEVVSIPYVERLGYRYINRVHGANRVAEIHSTIRESVHGGKAVPLVDDTEMIHTLSETIYRVHQNRLLARWAVLPENATVDPSIPPVNEPSWVLDLDSYREGNLAADPTSVVELARELAEVGYRFFRWAVDEDFLRRFGGEV